MNISNLLETMASILGISKLTLTRAIPPRVFIGTVTVGGEPALPGTGVAAVIRGKEKGFVQVHELGVYGPLYVENPASDPQITFKVGAQMADQAFAGDDSRATILDLTVNSDEPS